MNLKALFLIINKEKKIKKILDKYKLPFNYVCKGIGTASNSMLDYFGLTETEKAIMISLIPDIYEKELFREIAHEMKVEDIGTGIAFTVPLTSSSKYVKETFSKREGKAMKNKRDYQLIMTVVNTGHADKVMIAAKKAGATGGTVIKGREVGSKNAFKFLNATIEPEKDVVLIVCLNDDKKAIMEAIIEKEGIKQDGKGICFALPIDNAIGIKNPSNDVKK